ncbi:MAG: S41 family peptidase [Ruminococcus sp.]|nr:S41 family peptidase [Ruminococcus sp.]
MDNDTKHVFNILILVVCFGMGYYACKAENKDFLTLGGKFDALNRIETALDDKKHIEPDNESIAVENAVNSYYKSGDRYFSYTNELNIDEAEEQTVMKYDYSDKYRFIGDTVYINCSAFYLDGIQGFTRFFKEQKEKDVDGFIIDLRNNKGGYTDMATGVLGYLIERQTVGLYHYFDGSTRKINVSGDSFRTEKVVILVNEDTASASEIFTAVMMQFYSGDVTVIGTNTYGKGTFQEFANVSDTEQVKYTAGYYTIGDWQCYDGIGITPDIEVEMDYKPEIICTDNDIQFQTALDLFK